MNPPFAFAIAVLAAGASRRLGRPKQLIRMNGKHQGTTLLRHLAEQASRSSASHVGILLGANAAAIAPSLDGCSPGRLEILINSDWQEGIASSIRAAVLWAEALPCQGLVLSASWA